MSASPETGERHIGYRERTTGDRLPERFRTGHGTSASHRRYVSIATARHVGPA
ncbi:MAG: hypothetical protein QM207_11950 [Thermobispora sp.]|nr:hypothetical protein [Thermobispora sp.]